MCYYLSFVSASVHVNKLFYVLHSTRMVSRGLIVDGDWLRAGD